MSLSAPFVMSARLRAGETFDVLLGTGEHKGLLRLVRNNGAGVVTSRGTGKGGLVFDCGHIERFGTEREPKQFCRADIIAADTIEIILPPWADEQDV